MVVGHPGEAQDQGLVYTVTLKIMQLPGGATTHEEGGLGAVHGSSHHGTIHMSVMLESKLNSLTS